MAGINWLGDGAEIAAIVAGISVAPAAIAWWRRLGREARAEQKKNQLRTWSDTPAVDTIKTWHLRLAEEPGRGSTRVVLDVLDDHGNPDPAFALTLVSQIRADGQLCSVPTPEGYELLKAIFSDRRSKGGQVVR